jgi:sarcosine oxidase subunit beta
VASEGVALLPELANLRILRQWGGIMDMTMDGTPIIGRLPLEGLVMNGGWCYGGFKAIPAGGYTTAHLIARGEPHPLTTHMDLERFAEGRTFDEPGLGPFPWMH